MPRILQFFHPADMINTVLYQLQMQVCSMVSTEPAAGPQARSTAEFGCPWCLCRFDYQSDDSTHNSSPHSAMINMINTELTTHVFAATLTECSSSALPSLQFLNGTQIQAGQIPYLAKLPRLPGQGDPAGLIKALFAPLPLLDSTYYIPGAIIAGSSSAVNIDPATGAAPGFGTGMGLGFAINPCAQEYHFAIVVGRCDGFRRPRKRVMQSIAPRCRCAPPT